MTSHRTPFARGLALAAVAGMLVVACGGDEEPGAAERLRAYTRTRMQSDVDARYAALAEDY